MPNTSLQPGSLVFAGESAFAERLRVQVRRIARHYRTALLIGEAGCGKTETARELHRLSPVAGGPFLCCTAEEFASGGVEEVRFGTLYLRRLGEVPLAVQDELLKRLLRLESRPGFETRLIIGNNAPLRGIVASGRLRQELAARVSAIEIRIPRLRDRLEDLSAMLSGLTISQAALTRLGEHGWPGNLDELRSALSHATLASAGHRIETHHLPALASPDKTPFPEPGAARLDFVMKRHVTEVLERCAGNKLRAAEMLGISRSTLYRMLDTPITDV